MIGDLVQLGATRGADHPFAAARARLEDLRDRLRASVLLVTCERAELYFLVDAGGFPSIADDGPGFPQSLTRTSR